MTAFRVPGPSKLLPVGLTFADKRPRRWLRVLIGLGVLLPWGRAVVGPFHQDVAGIKGWEGQVTGILAIGMVVRGIAAWNSNKRGERSRLAGAAVVTGLVASGIALYDLFTARIQMLDHVVGDGAGTIARQTGLPVDVVTSRLRAMIESGTIRLEFEIGIYLVVLGGLGSVAGTALAALILAAVEVFAILVIPAYLTVAVGFVLLVLVLVLRPGGLFGQRVLG